MSAFTIKDASTGNIMRVNSLGLGQVQARSINTSDWGSLKDRTTFRAPTFVQDVQTGAERDILWIRNVSQTKGLIFSRIHTSHNGGDTLFNRPLRMRAYIGATRPTAQFVANAAIVCGSADTPAPGVDALRWDGTGTGLVLAGRGTLTQEWWAGPGYTNWDSSGILVLPANLFSGGFVAADLGVLFTMTPDQGGGNDFQAEMTPFLTAFDLGDF